MYNQITISTTTQGADIISQILIDNGSQGVYIEDPNDANFVDKDKEKWDYIDEKVFDYGHEDCKVTGYYKKEEDIIKIIKNIENSFENLKNVEIDFGKLIIEKTSIYEKDWENEWKKYFHVSKISDSIVIKPSWEEYEAKENEKVIEIDPGLAFGTGTHETTRMCINAIEKYLDKKDSLIDVGCGSGVLAIAAKLLGASKVIAIDIDPLAVKVTHENLKINNISDVKIIQGDLVDKIKNKSNIIVANIIADMIINLSKEAYKLLEDGGYFISSGIIEEKKDEVIEKLKKDKFEIIEILQDKSWICIVAKKIKESDINA